MLTRLNYLQLIKAYPSFITYGMLHYFFSSFGQTFLISIFVPYFLQHFDITNLTFSYLYSGATIASAAIIHWAGPLVDRIKIRYVSLAIGILLAVFCFGLSIINGVIFLFFILLGLRFSGQGMLTLTGSTATARYFEANRGKALSLNSIGLSIGESILPLAITGLAAIMSWQQSWQMASALILIVFIPAVFLLVPQDHDFQQLRNPPNQQQSKLQRKKVLKDYKFWGLTLSMIFLPFFITGMFIHQNLLAENKGWTMEWMAVSFTGFGLVRIATNLFSGPLIDYFTARRVFVIYLIPLVLGVMILYFTDNKFAAIFYMLLLGISTSLNSVSSSALWAELYGIQFLGSIKSMVTTLIVFSSALGPLIIGWFLEKTGNLNLLLIISVVLMIILTFISGKIVNTYNRESKS